MPEMLTMSVEHADGDLERRVVSTLMERQVPALRQITVAVSNGIVTLKGRVQSFYVRQLCLICCQRIVGVRKLVDLIEVAA